MKFASVRLKKSTIKPVLSFVFFSLCFVLLYLSYGRTTREGAIRAALGRRPRQNDPITNHLVGRSDYSRPFLSRENAGLMAKKPMTKREADALGPVRGGSNQLREEANDLLWREQREIRASIMPRRDEPHVTPAALRALRLPTKPKPEWRSGTQFLHKRPIALGRPAHTSQSVNALPSFSPPLSRPAHAHGKPVSTSCGSKTHRFQTFLGGFSFFA